MKMNKKGFTLIELLAVIVVLAIIMVLATTTVLPLLSTARKKSFATEAQAAVSTASNIMSLIPLGTITSTDLGTNGADYKDIPGTSKSCKCFSLKKMVDLGVYTLDSGNIGIGKYEGYVVATITSGSNNYSYKVKMHNQNFSVEKTGTTIDEKTDVKDYTVKNSVDTAYNCSTVTTCP